MLKELAKKLQQNQQAIEKWYLDKLSSSKPCFYSSVDIRFSGEKLVQVDTNLFPAGFNNLSLDNIVKSSELANNYINTYYPDAKKILLIGEDHSRNLYYLDNLKTLQKILEEADFEVRAALLSATEYNKVDGIVHKDIETFPLSKINGRLQTLDGFIPDIILLNNDLSLGIPEVLNNIEQKIIPHPNNGWFYRRKSKHFAIYNKLLEELEELFSLPTYFLKAEFDVCKGINFKTQQGIDDLAHRVEKLLAQITAKYIKYQIKQDPYVVIKSDYGTYGMGIMIVKNKDEIYSLNKKLRNQMHVTKNNVINEQVIIQEGIKTIDKVGQASAEPLIYLINHTCVEFLYRIHKGKDEYSNLNSVGMEISNNHKVENDYEEYQYCCKFIARLASLAAALEN